MTGNVIIAPTLAFSRKGRAVSEISALSSDKVIIIDKKIGSMIPAGGASKIKYHSNGPKHSHDMESIHAGVKKLEDVAEAKYMYYEKTKRKILTGYPEMGISSNLRLRQLSQL